MFLPGPRSIAKSGEQAVLLAGQTPLAFDSRVQPHVPQLLNNRVFVVGARGIPDVEGGAEKNAERLFPRLAERGWDISLTVISRYCKGSNYRGVKLVSTPYSRLLRTDKIAYYLVALTLALRQRPAIVHLQGLGAAVFLWAYRLMGVRVVVRYGSADYILSKWGFIGRLGFRFAEYQLRFAHAVIAVSPALAQRLAAHGIHKNVHVIPNALDEPTDFAEPASDVVVPRPYFLSVGRITEQKNVHRLVEAFSIFAKKNTDMHLVVAGGIDDPAYFEQVKPFLNDRVHFLGRVPRSSLGGIYANAYAYINASVHEGHSNATMEAISWKLPTLVSDIPENRDLHLPDHHLFDPVEVADIVEALERVANDRNAYRCGDGMFLSWDDVAERTNAVYQSLWRTPVGSA